MPTAGQKQMLAIRHLIQAEVIASLGDEDTEIPFANRVALADYQFGEMCAAFGHEVPDDEINPYSPSGARQ